MPARATESDNLRAATRTPALIIDRAKSAIRAKASREPGDARQSAPGPQFRVVDVRTNIGQVADVFTAPWPHDQNVAAALLAHSPGGASAELREEP